ncbi:MAG TPA: DNA-3-methyladenine glycosylase [Noviherbaspirillum sp.]|nr:DNA-3-methyladenine glycosylase [Noviherbaspirillum sp.]
MTGAALPREFYARPTVDVARDLLGMQLIHRVDGTVRRGRIVEVEAYVGAHDLASHSSRGVTPRTSVMYGPPGHAYVYLIYGMHHCVNVVTEPAGHGAAVLLRALEPLDSLAGNTRGPGLLCRTMGITLARNGIDLTGDVLFITLPPEAERFEIVQSARVGVAYAGDWADAPLRFSIAGNPYVSRASGSRR